MSALRAKDGYEKKCRSQGVIEYEEMRERLTPVLGNQMDDNGNAINQQNGIKSKYKLFHDNLKQFHYKTQLLMINHFYMLHIKLYIISL